jgi:hypothetical protein
MPVKKVTLKWFVAACDEKGCGWEGNPTPDEAHASEHLAFHKATVHPVEDEAE